ncbi:hypothetical protein [Pseudomonas rubra]|uniref:Uncharacterized protein n=1 Tax=Pseudomonas rubra TaxID=2942627 RepID=A0ABT5P5X6_9PSED|nr:hypothetical protein [Pseudomonas rubra]MDD1013581.1 hypothetical protein [Pseudomonas rubra]MDD1040101.1 hypothetical protein [Pseudomonas rubra]MDD1155893.1 hypothetical protein [Pseudomonas rubra]
MPAFDALSDNPSTDFWRGEKTCIDVKNKALKYFEKSAEKHRAIVGKME